MKSGTDDSREALPWDNELESVASAELVPLDMSVVPIDYSPLLYSPPSPVIRSLDLEEIDLLDYFWNSIAPKFSVVPHRINTFHRTTMQMAMSDEAVMQCLLAWASIVRGRQSGESLALCTANSDFVKRHSDVLLRRDRKEPTQFVVFLFCYAILMCIEISIGDTDAWSRYLTKSYDLLNEMGGFNVLAGFSYEGKIIAQNFAYFDILASQSNLNGTYYPVEEYNEVFYRGGADTLDSMQGCIRPLVLLLGDVINLIVDSKDIISESAEQNWDEVGTMLARATDLERRVERAEVHPSDYRVLVEHDAIDKHLVMFSLYKLVIQVYIKLSIRRFPPVVLEIQLLRRAICKYLLLLIDTPLALALTFPLLIAGVVSVQQKERRLVIAMIDAVVNHYGFDNIKKVKLVLYEVWKENDNGRHCVDWFEITRKFGWRLNAGR